MKNYLKWGALLLLIFMVLTIGSTFAVNEKEINATGSTNITNANTNTATLRNLNITTNVAKINNLTININLLTLKNETKKMIETTDVETMAMNPTDTTTKGTKSQNPDNSGGGCPCNSQG